MHFHTGVHCQVIVIVITWSLFIFLLFEKNTFVKYNNVSYYIHLTPTCIL